MKLIKNKHGEILQQVVMHIILIAIIFAVFFTATAGRIDSREVRQQIIEKQTALLIDSAIPGMSFSLEKIGLYGEIGDLRISEGRVYGDLVDFPSIKGYPYFSKYNIYVDETEDKFIVRVE